MSLAIGAGGAEAQSAPASLAPVRTVPWSAAAPLPGPLPASARAVEPAPPGSWPETVDVVTVAEVDLLTGAFRYRVPEGARPFAVPYLAVGAALLATDPYVLRALKRDSLYLRDDGAAAHEAHLAFRALSHLGDPPLVVFALGTLWALGGSREREAAHTGAIAYANAISVTAIGKFLTGKERPYVSGGRLRYNGPNLRHASFPSGHSSGTASVAHVMAHYYPDGRLAWYGLAGAAGLSRIALARHWPSDVWWGWGVGVVGAEGALRERER